MKIAILTLAINVIALASAAQEIQVSSGKVQRFDSFKSEFIDARNIDVWVPDDYSIDDKYAVLYMNDGQMLFDSTKTWNKQSWEVDEVASKLMAESLTKKFIVVGIWNNEKKRHAEYLPQKVYDSLSQQQKDIMAETLQKTGRIVDSFSPLADNYLKFIVGELKPFIDKNFSVKKDRKNTFIAGSSMGALISLYAICEYPDVFGGAACISTHWTVIYTTENNPIPDAIASYLKTHLPKPRTHKIYFDYGDQTLDALYKPLQEKVDIIMEQRGYTSKNWITKYFPGADHSEKSWHARLESPLLFLFKN